MSPVLIRLSDLYVYVWDKRNIYLYQLVYVIKLVLKFNGIAFICIWCYISQLPFSTYFHVKGYRLPKSIDFLNPFLCKICVYLFKCL